MTPLDPLDRAQIIVSSILIAGTFLILFYGIFATENSEPQPKFQVVDRYENCDVIRYTDSTQRWNYLLKCNE